jgi:hypothetical protein
MVELQPKASVIRNTRDARTLHRGCSDTLHRVKSNQITFLLSSSRRLLSLQAIDVTIAYPTTAYGTG